MTAPSPHPAAGGRVRTLGLVAVLALPGSLAMRALTGDATTPDGVACTQPEGRPAFARTLPAWTLAAPVGAGRPLATALREAGLAEPEISGIVQALRPHHDFRRTPADAIFEVCVEDSPVGEAFVERFTLRTGPLDVVEAVRRGDGSFSACSRTLPVEIVEAEVAASIETSLWDAIESAGESPELAAVIAEVFAWDLDFSRDQHPGDAFRMIVERVERDGQLVRYGQVLAAEYAGRRGTHRAFWFDADGDGRGHYYLEDGRSAQKSFLATPLEYTRVSSKFSKRRKHPVLGYTRAHQGTDFAAPRGTPVRSMAEGRVSFSGRKGGYGKVVVVDHADGLQTWYAHLDSIAKGIRGGARVQQKTLLGRVGSTGLATGPHLHLGMKRRGKWIDPQSLKVARSEPVPAKYAAAFREQTSRQLTRLAAMTPREQPLEVATGAAPHRFLP